MFAIMGATGQTGRAAVAHLRRSGQPVRAISRDSRRAAALFGPEVDVAAADPADPAALAAAFAGAWGVYAMLPPLPGSDDVVGDCAAMARAVAEAVRRSGVRRVVALSSGGAHLAAGSGVVRTLHDFEAALRRTDADVTFLRAADFLDNWAPMVAAAPASGMLPSARLPLDAPMETVSAEDVGRTAAELLVEEWHGLRVVDLLGPQEVTPQDVAAAVAVLSGRPVRAVPLPPESLVPALLEAGAGPDYARLLAQLYAGLNAGRVGFDGAADERRRGTVTLLQAVRRMLEPVPAGVT